MKVTPSLLVAFGLASLFHQTVFADSKVALERVPENGIQPRAEVDSRGVLHLIYFKGDPKAGDLFYVKKSADETEFSKPIQINHLPGSAIAVGTIRGAHLAVGPNGGVHVAWNGSGQAARTSADSPAKVHPMLYTRLNDAGTAFEEERNLLTWTGGLDGGGSLAVDGARNVYVAWHGIARGAPHGEHNRAVYIARSSDGGKTFSRESRANPEPTGVCGCCGMRAFVDRDDSLYLLYRTANDSGRDMSLLVSRNQGGRFENTPVNRWKIQTCPMSSAALGERNESLYLATEKQGFLILNRFFPEREPSGRLGDAIDVGKGKHPAIAVNRRGEILIAWAEGAGWNQGGRLQWKIFGKDHKPIAASNDTEEIPTWSFPAAVAQADDSFLIFY